MNYDNEITFWEGLAVFVISAFLVGPFVFGLMTIITLPFVH